MQDFWRFIWNFQVDSTPIILGKFRMEICTFTIHSENCYVRRLCRKIMPNPRCKAFFRAPHAAGASATNCNASCQPLPGARTNKVPLIQSVPTRRSSSSSVWWYWAWQRHINCGKYDNGAAGSRDRVRPTTWQVTCESGRSLAISRRSLAISRRSLAISEETASNH